MTTKRKYINIPPRQTLSLIKKLENGPFTVLGRGTFGTIILQDNNNTAVKYMFSRTKKRIEDEIETLTFFKGLCAIGPNPHIIEPKCDWKIFPMEVGDSWTYVGIIPMEYIGPDLFDFLYGRIEKLKRDDALHIIKSLRDGFKYLKANGVCHSDIKPRNIVISEKRPYRVKFIDFGLSCKQENCRITGTPSYMHPEISKKQLQFLEKYKSFPLAEKKVCELSDDYAIRKVIAEVRRKTEKERIKSKKVSKKRNSKSSKKRSSKSSKKRSSKKRKENITFTCRKGLKDCANMNFTINPKRRVKF